tara:strand:- start:314 stop:484 length:171 start_codon:yes stop_codon:yes gene_type:complete
MSQSSRRRRRRFAGANFLSLALLALVKSKFNDLTHPPEGGAPHWAAECQIKVSKKK